MFLGATDKRSFLPVRTRSQIPNSISIAENAEVFLREHNLQAAAAESATRSAQVAHQCSCRNTESETWFFGRVRSEVRLYSCTTEEADEIQDVSGPCGVEPSVSWNNR